jgi:hypothetical protein
MAVLLWSCGLAVVISWSRAPACSVLRVALCNLKCAVCHSPPRACSVLHVAFWFRGLMALRSVVRALLVHQVTAFVAPYIVESKCALSLCYGYMLHFWPANCRPWTVAVHLPRQLTTRRSPSRHSRDYAELHLLAPSYVKKFSKRTANLVPRSRRQMSADCT